MSAVDLLPPRRKMPWILSLLALVAVAGLIAMPFLAGPPDGDKMPDFVRFIGHFHPVVLHLPIGIFYLVVFQELVAMFARRDHKPRPASLFPPFFGAASAIVAVLAGFCLYHGGAEYKDNALADRHLWAGLSFAILAVLTYVLKAWTVALEANPALYRLMLFLSVGVMTWASHDGGSITHGEPYLTEFAPDPLRKMMGLPAKKEHGQGGHSSDSASSIGAAPADPVVYADIVSPVLENRCMSCHKESKSKGKLRMDTYEMLVKGGKEGSDLVPGDSKKSNIIVRAELPEDDDDRMPPEGKKGLADYELVVLKWWIDSGADPKKKLSEYDVPPPVKEALAKISPHSATKEAGAEVAQAPKVADAPPKEAVAAVTKDYPGALSFESQESPLLSFTAVSLRGTLDDAGFSKVAVLAPNFVTLDLAATKITDASIVPLSSAKNLRAVRLSQTAVTDAAIDTLVKLPSLESVNLYGTKVTDGGVKKLAALPNLKKLYLWQTSVSPEAIKELQAKLPNCEIITGAGL